MTSVMYPARKEKVDDSGFLRTPTDYRDCVAYVNDRRTWAI